MVNGRRAGRAPSFRNAPGALLVGILIVALLTGPLALPANAAFSNYARVAPYSSTVTTVCDSAYSTYTCAKIADGSYDDANDKYVAVATGAKGAGVKWTGSTGVPSVMSTITHVTVRYRFATAISLVCGTEPGGSGTGTTLATGTATTSTYITWDVDVNGSTCTSGPVDSLVFYASSNTSSIEVVELEVYGSAPQGVHATPSDQTCTVGWNALGGADSYKVKWSTISGGTFQTAASGLTGTSYVHSGLTNGVRYYYAVIATSGGVDGNSSTEASCIPAAAANVTPAPTPAPSPSAVPVPQTVSYNSLFLDTRGRGGNVVKWVLVCDQVNTLANGGACETSTGGGISENQAYFRGNWNTAHGEVALAAQITGQGTSSGYGWVQVWRLAQAGDGTGLPDGSIVPGGCVWGCNYGVVSGAWVAPPSIYALSTSAFSIDSLYLGPADPTGYGGPQVYGGRYIVAFQCNTTGCVQGSGFVTLFDDGSVQGFWNTAYPTPTPAPTPTPTAGVTASPSPAPEVSQCGLQTQCYLDQLTRQMASLIVAAQNAASAGVVTAVDAVTTAVGALSTAVVAAVNAVETAVNTVNTSVAAVTTAVNAAKDAIVAAIGGITIDTSGIVTAINAEKDAIVGAITGLPSALLTAAQTAGSSAITTATSGIGSSASTLGSTLTSKQPFAFMGRAAAGLQTQLDRANAAVENTSSCDGFEVTLPTTTLPPAVLFGVSYTPVPAPSMAPHMLACSDLEPIMGTTTWQDIRGAMDPAIYLLYAFYWVRRLMPRLQFAT